MQAGPMSISLSIDTNLPVSYLRYLLLRKLRSNVHRHSSPPPKQSASSRVQLGHLTWFANRALGNSNEMTIGRCSLKPGHTNGRHYHPNCSETLVVVQGRIRHTLTSDQETKLAEGDTVVIPPNVRHCATNIDQTDAILSSPSHRRTAKPLVNRRQPIAH